MLLAILFVFFITELPQGECNEVNAETEKLNTTKSL